MSGGGSRLSPREHDELRDLVLAGAQRIRPAGSGRAKVVAAAIALVLVGAVAGAILANVVRDDAPIAPAPAPEGASEGWVAFTAGREGTDVYMVKEASEWRGEGSERAPIQGDHDAYDDVCPAFSPDGSRLVAGRSGRTAAEEASLVVADIAADGTTSGVTTIPLDGVSEAPCAQWSPSGEWVAFGTDTRDPGPLQEFATLWLVNVTTRETHTLPTLSASDFAWSADSEKVYIATGGSIYVYAPGAIRMIEGVTDAVFLDVSPDGRTLAVARGDVQRRERYDLWVMDADGSNPRMLVEDYLATHGVGPVWSPDGGRIVIQRMCDTFTNEDGSDQICREQHLALVVDVTDGTQTEIPAPQTAVPAFRAGPGPLIWYPWSITWSPDGTRLLYVAWPQGEVSEEGLVGLLSVPVDGSDPLLLYAGSDVRVYSGFPWNTMQAWSPARDGGSRP